MFCDNCQKNDATIHIQEIVGKKRRAIHLCAACAAHQGLPLAGELPADLDIPKLLMSLAQQALPAAAESAPAASGAERKLKCMACGLTAAEFRKQMRLGCPQCYSTFSRLLAPILAGMHRGVVHAGKRPAGEAAAPRVETPVPLPEPPLPADLPAAPPPPSLVELKTALALAIGKEDYESAAKLRDAIRKRG